MTYTKEQEEDIIAREKQGLEALKTLNLTPAASVQKFNIGNDMFTDKVIPYLRDTKYTPTPSVTSNEVQQDESPTDDTQLA
jgi:hypothetical protein